MQDANLRHLEHAPDAAPIGSLKPDTTPGLPVAAADAAGAASQRRLEDGVLQTAQEAVLAPAPEDTHAIGYESAGNGYAPPRKPVLARYVADHPAQSAALAALAGGLVVLLLKSSLKASALSGTRARLARGKAFLPHFSPFSRRR